MSIPWPGSSHHQLVQLTTVLATFLSPLALALLTKSTCSLVRCIRRRVEQRPPSCYRRQTRDPGTCCDRPRAQVTREAGLDVKDKAVLENGRRGFKRDLTILLSSGYCACYSSVNLLDTRRDLDSECGDCGQIPNMELCDTERPPGDLVPVQFATNYTKSSNNQGLRSNTYKSQFVEICCQAKQSHHELSETSKSESTDEESLSTKSQENFVSPLLHLDNEAVKDIKNEEENTAGRNASQEKVMETKETAGTGKDLALDSKERVTSCPKIQVVPTGEIPDPGDIGTCGQRGATDDHHKTQAENVDEISKKQDPKNSEAVEQTNGNLVEGAEEGREKATAVPEGTFTTDEQSVNQREQKSPVCDGPDSKGSDVDLAVRPKVRQRGKFNTSRDRSKKVQPPVEQIVQEAAAEPCIGLSRSSCESFSTAYCSSTSSASQQSASEQDDDYYCQSRDACEQGDDMNKSSQAHSSRRDQSSPVFEFANPQPLFSGTQDRQTDSSRQTNRKKSRKDRVADHPGQSNEKTNKIINLSEWIRSTFESWLPFSQSRNAHRVPSSQGPTQRDKSSQFHEYDVRNVLSRDNTGFWGSNQTSRNAELKPCPHSCVSSLCNFRRTLETWKKELLEMHNALEASSMALSQNPCTFCHKDHQCKGFANCHTMHVAQQFWRMVLEMKQSFVQPNECPHIGQQKVTNPKADTSGGKVEQCCLGHWHSCSHDFLGCSQQRNCSRTPDAQEAPCVHVLLNELDLLQKKLQMSRQYENDLKLQPSQRNNVTQNTDGVHGRDDISSSNSTQHEDEDSLVGSRNAASSHSVTAKTSNTKNDGNVNKSHETSNTSMVSPSISVSLTEELEELEELTDFFLGEGKQATNPQKNTKLKDCDSMSAEHSVQNLMPDSHPTSQQSLQQCAESEDLQASGKSRTLGRFALRYLEHIENNLDTETVTPTGCTQSSTALTCGGDSPRPLLRTNCRRVNSSLQSYSGSTTETPQTQSETTAEKIRENTSFNKDTLHSESDIPVGEVEYLTDYFNNQSDQSQQLSNERSQQESKTFNVDSFKSCSREEKKPNLKTAFDSIIADLVQFQQKQSRQGSENNLDALPDKCTKNVKFSPSSTKRSESMSSLSSPSVSSSSLHFTVPNNSACSSLTGGDVCMKDLTVTQAFDQLDKIVDDLLRLMDGTREQDLDD